MEKEEKVSIIESLETHKEHGFMSKMTFDNGSNIYIHKKGWTISHPEMEKDINLSWSEINIAIKQSIKNGYAKKS